MAKTVLIDELHLTVRVPADLPEAESQAVRQALLADAFLAAVRRAVRTAFRAFPELARCRLAVTR